MTSLKKILLIGILALAPSVMADIILPPVRRLPVRRPIAQNKVKVVHPDKNQDVPNSAETPEIENKLPAITDNSILDIDDKKNSDTITEDTPDHQLDADTHTTAE